MVDKIANDARIYTDIQGLENLRYQSGKHPEAVKKEVAHQFEAILMQMVMRSMRDANKSFSSDLFGGDDMDVYQDMFDKQLSMMTADNGTGFAKMVETNINNQYFPNAGKTSAATEALLQTFNRDDATVNTPKELPIVKKDLPTAVVAQEDKIRTPQDFVAKLWPAAKSAARMLGTDPKILLAQAALETNWGKKIIPHENSSSSFNLFNIKADPSWDKNTTTMATLEQQDGIISKVKAKFRSYASYAESFKDYVSFIKQNNRYSQALSQAANPQAYVHALQNAGFATDSNYADKVLKIFSSNMFKSLIDKLE